MIIKVCGMREAQNAEAVAELGITMMGFILYPKSPRYIGDDAPATPSNIKRVGVFVNASMEEIEQRVARDNFDYVQLHGAESVEMCRALRAAKVGVIKAISIASPADFDLAARYDGEVDYLLFDTKCTGYGGSGEQFNWSILESYKGSTPFLLSGGIDDGSAEAIGAINHTQFAGIDLNSRFEQSPAVKDVKRLQQFINRLK